MYTGGRLSFLVSSMCFLVLGIVSHAWAFWLNQLVDNPGKFLMYSVVTIGVLFLLAFLVLKLGGLLDMFLAEPTTISEKRFSDAVHAISHIVVAALWWWGLLSFGDKLPDHFVVLIPVILFCLYSITMLMIPALFGLSKAITGSGYRIIQKDGKQVVEGWR